MNEMDFRILTRCFGRAPNITPTLPYMHMPRKEKFGQFEYGATAGMSWVTADFPELTFGITSCDTS
jgi:hypothetical protein